MKPVPSTRAIKNWVWPLRGADGSSTPFSKTLPRQTMLSRGRLSTKALPGQRKLSSGYLFSNTAVPDAHACSFDLLGCCQEMGAATLSVESIAMHLHVHPVTGQSPCSLKENEESSSVFWSRPNRHSDLSHTSCLSAWVLPSLASADQDLAVLY